ncbi:hypothetical protein GCM10025882_18830 [Acinetobacter gyllenbergii]|uniref:Uncharacterized protein n=2 Tax=Acinetobacter TaxID=469 RepID=A0A829HBD1_9GAMM|nr:MULTISPECIES: hypothetical protein [Acinetobacter]ENX55386.1 hypothetical protein F902_03456 [Acinetobacter higginsii]EPF69463.1 hypothetical protein F957_04034 [Acinetobacter gyllenbergii CIP 110306 = MTCC 11365]ESK44030.1 hypothetical protein F987_01956 [Acinetobacter gyllenbergii NIPH 230]GMA11458.1 hypothetical protein GCM10025882_18830 [Acinetobacter gyllenbergii]
MKSNQEIASLIEKIEDMELEKAYFVYIKFCYKIIPLLNSVHLDYVAESIEDAKLFWFYGESYVAESEIIDRRVKILKCMKEKNISYDVNVQPELKFSILPLWTKPPSSEIGDSLDWAFTLLKVIGISDETIKTKLSEALCDIF